MRRIRDIGPRYTIRDLLTANVWGRIGQNNSNSLQAHVLAVEDLSKGHSMLKLVWTKDTINLRCYSPSKKRFGKSEKFEISDVQNGFWKWIVLQSFVDEASALYWLRLRTLR